jgi:hypothetical protein
MKRTKQRGPGKNAFAVAENDEKEKSALEVASRPRFFLLYITLGKAEGGDWLNRFIPFAFTPPCR